MCVCVCVGVWGGGAEYFHHGNSERAHGTGILGLIST